MSPAEKGSDRNDGKISAEDRAEFKRRSAEIGRRLGEARPQSSRSKSANGSDGSDGNEMKFRALRVSTELIGGIVVGAGIGWWLDTYLMPTAFGVRTWPLMFIVFFLFGSAAGILNVVRSGMKIKTGPSDPSKGPAVPDDEDDVK